MNFEEIWGLIKTNLDNFLETDWSIVQYKHRDFAILATIILVVAFLLKLSWPRLSASIFRRPVSPKSSYWHSGYRSEKQDRPGWIYKIAIFFTTSCVILGSAPFVVTIADPYIIQSHEKRPIRSREIVYVKDSSVSAGFRYKNQRVTRAEIMTEFLSRLIVDRKDQNDRAGFVIYATYPFLEADFTTDYKSLLFSVNRAPQVIADPITPKVETYKGLFIAKDFMAIDFGGESDLFLGLHTAIKLFDERGDPKITEEIKANPSLKRRSVIIATDGASSRDPEEQFKELKKRGIVPYLVYIDPDKQAERKIHGEGAPEVRLPAQLLKQVRRYGGEYFVATEQTSLAEIRQRLNALHAAVIDVKIETTEQHIYRGPLVVSMIFFVLAIFSRLLLFWFHRIV